MAKIRGDQPARPSPKSDFMRCQWISAYGQCCLWWDVQIDGIGSYCTFHARCRIAGYSGNDYQEFETFCLECYRFASYFLDLDIPALWNAVTGKVPATQPREQPRYETPSPITSPQKRQECLEIIDKVMKGLNVEEAHSGIANTLNPDVPF